VADRLFRSVSGAWGINIDEAGSEVLSPFHPVSAASVSCDDRRPICTDLPPIGVTANPRALGVPSCARCALLCR
jgi:hypothetical protein